MSRSIAARAYTPRGGAARIPVRAALLVAAVALSAWGLPRNPAFQEWRFSRMRLLQLQRESDHDNPLLLLYLGKRLNEAGRFTEADPWLRHAVGLDPGSARLRDEWARALLGSGLTTAAFGELREYAGTHPGSADAQMLLGKFYFTQHAWSRAVDELQRATQLNPDSAEAWAYLAGAASAEGSAHADLALDAARHAVRLRPWSADDALVYARMLALTHHVDNARGEYLRAVRLAPEQEVGHREFASFLLDNGSSQSDRALAVSEARRAAAAVSTDSLAQLTLGRALAQVGDSVDAIGPLKLAALSMKDDSAPAEFLAQTYHILGSLREAQAWRQEFLRREQYATTLLTFTHGVMEHPMSPACNARLARLFGTHGNVAGCVRHYATALRRPLDSPPVLAAASNALVEGGHAVDALPLAQRAALIGTRSPAAHAALGSALLALNRPDEAVEQFDQAAIRSPALKRQLQQKVNSYYANSLRHPGPAELAYRAARSIEAAQVGPRRVTAYVEAMAARAVALAPGDMRYRRYLLAVQMARRENAEAADTARTVLAVSPNDARISALLAILLLDRASSHADIDEAAKHLQAAAREPSIGATYHYAMGLLYTRRGKLPAAVRELRTASAMDPTAEITFYRLAEVDRRLGNASDAARAADAFRRITHPKRAEMVALGDIATQPDRPELYLRAERLYRDQGEPAKAEAIREAALQRFGRPARAGAEPR